MRLLFTNKVNMNINPFNKGRGKSSFRLPGMRTPPFVTVMGVAPPVGPPPVFLTMGGIITFFTFGGIVTPEVVAVVIKTVPPAPVEVTAGTFQD